MTIKEQCILIPVPAKPLSAILVSKPSPFSSTNNDPSRRAHFQPVYTPLLLYFSALIISVLIPAEIIRFDHTSYLGLRIYELLISGKQNFGGT
jgi:hypothetical protein